MRRSDVVVVGGGVLGLAVARQITRERPGAEVVVLEKELTLASHQTGRSSGVVHAGLSYRPGSLKAMLCRRGVGLLQDFCEQHGIRYDEVGKVVVARDAAEVAGLDAVEEKARANGVPGLRRLGPEGIREVEPHVTGVAALHSPRTAVTDFVAVAHGLAEEVVAAGGSVVTGAEVTSVRRGAAGGVELLADGLPYAARRLVVCAGLQGDRVAALVGASRDPAIVPFRGEYAELVPERRHLVRGLVYPVPDPRYPFLGVHLTRHVDGGVLVGPNAVMALAREGYSWRDVSPRDLLDTARWPGTWHMARAHWRTGVREVRGSLDRRAFLKEARTFVPDLRAGDLVKGRSGVRAQALDRRGRLVDDFRLERRGPVVLVRNAPSPGATSSLAIAEHVVKELAAAG